MVFEGRRADGQWSRDRRWLRANRNRRLVGRLLEGDTGSIRYLYHGRRGQELQRQVKQRWEPGVSQCAVEGLVYPPDVTEYHWWGLRRIFCKEKKDSVRGRNLLDRGAGRGTGASEEKSSGLPKKAINGSSGRSVSGLCRPSSLSSGSYCPFDDRGKIRCAVAVAAVLCCWLSEVVGWSSHRTGLSFCRLGSSLLVTIKRLFFSSPSYDISLDEDINIMQPFPSGAKLWANRIFAHLPAPVRVGLVPGI